MSGQQSNNPINATVRPVTPLANTASGAPVRPARYRVRSADMKAATTCAVIASASGLRTHRSDPRNTDDRHIWRNS